METIPRERKVKWGGGRVLVQFPQVSHLFIDIPLIDKGVEIYVINLKPEFHHTGGG